MIYHTIHDVRGGEMIEKTDDERQRHHHRPVKNTENTSRQTESFQRENQVTDEQPPDFRPVEIAKIEERVEEDFLDALLVFASVHEVADRE